MGTCFQVPPLFKAHRSLSDRFRVIHHSSIERGGRRVCLGGRINAQRTFQSWGGEAPDWELQPYDSDAEVEEELDASVLPPDGEGSTQFAFQNALAAALLAAIVLSVGNIVVKLAVVAFALVSAAFRYTAVGFFVIFILALCS
jgi:hypothetical protein